LSDASNAVADLPTCSLVADDDSGKVSSMQLVSVSADMVSADNIFKLLFIIYLPFFIRM
jgi:hypothetical protein